MDVKKETKLLGGEGRKRGIMSGRMDVAVANTYTLAHTRAHNHSESLKNSRAQSRANTHVRAQSRAPTGGSMSALARARTYTDDSVKLTHKRCRTHACARAGGGRDEMRPIILFQ